MADPVKKSSETVPGGRLNLTDIYITIPCFMTVKAHFSPESWICV